jgi:hypothetical protein
MSIVLLAGLFFTGGCFADQNNNLCCEQKLAQEMVNRYINYNKLQLKLQLVEDANKELQLAIVDLDVVVDSLHSQLKTVNVQLSATRAELTKATAWYKSPYLWIAVGLVAGSVATIGVASALR